MKYPRTPVSAFNKLIKALWLVARTLSDRATYCWAAIVFRSRIAYAIATPIEHSNGIEIEIDPRLSIGSRFQQFLSLYQGFIKGTVDGYSLISIVKLGNPSSFSTG